MNQIRSVLSSSRLADQTPPTRLCARCPDSVDRQRGFDGRRRYFPSVKTKEDVEHKFLILVDPLVRGVRNGLRVSKFGSRTIASLTTQQGCAQVLCKLSEEAPLNGHTVQDFIAASPREFSVIQRIHAK